jgi:hypothetical protein
MVMQHNRNQSIRIAPESKSDHYGVHQTLLRVAKAAETLRSGFRPVGLQPPKRLDVRTVLIPAF